MPRGPNRWLRRWGSIAILAGLGGCGSRTDLFDGFPDDSDDDITEDAGDTLDAQASRDSSVAFDAGRDAGVRDAAPPRDAGFDAAPILCAFNAQTTLADLGNVEIDQVSLDDSYVYFHGGEHISRVAKSGGPTTQLATLETPSWPDVTAFALDDTGITWWQMLNGKAQTNILHVPKSGGTPTTVATLGNYFAYGSGGASGSIYTWYGGGLNPSLDNVAANGTVTEIVSTLPYTTPEVVWHDGVLYAVGSAGIYRFDGTTFDLIAPVPAGLYPNLMVVDDTNIYVSSSDGSSDFVVSSIPKSGGAFTNLLTVANAYLGGIKVDADHLWVVERAGPANTASILRMNKDGTDETVFASLVGGQIGDVAVDDQCVYWTEGTGTSRVRVAPK